MALTLLIAGAYAGYIAQQQAEMAKCDESINMEGKTKLKLLKGEQASILEIPLTCINWFQGDYRKVVPHLQQRVEEVLQKNPFLGGWLIFDKDDNLALTLLYDPKGQDLNNREKTFTVFDKDELSITPTTNYAECTRQLVQVGAMLPLQHELIGKDKPIFRISIVPDAKQPTEQFALVISKTHALGDSHTFYKIVGMLDIATGYAQQMIAEREHTVAQLIRQKMGEEAVNHLKTALKNPPMDMTETRNEPTVMKVFHVKESWFARKNKGARRGSMFAEVSTDVQNGDTVTLSENSILASWFFQLTQADIAFMGLSMRDRLDGCLVNEFHAGNYVAGIPYTPSDYDSAELVELSVAHLKRQGPTSNEDLPPFRWNNSASLSLNWASKFQTKLQLLPAAQADECNQLSHLILFDAAIMEKVPGRLSLCYMFTSVPSEARVEGSGVEVLLPESNPTSSMADTAAKLAAELEAGGEEVLEEYQDEAKQQSHGKRAGILVVCRQSVWDEMEKSGIVEEMIVDN